MIVLLIFFCLQCRSCRVDWKNTGRKGDGTVNTNFPPECKLQYNRPSTLLTTHSESFDSHCQLAQQANQPRKREREIDSEKRAKCLQSSEAQASQSICMREKAASQEVERARLLPVGISRVCRGLLRLKATDFKAFRLVMTYLIINLPGALIAREG